MAQKTRLLATNLEEVLLNGSRVDQLREQALELTELAQPGLLHAVPLLVRVREVASTGVLGHHTGFFKSHLVTQVAIWAHTTCAMSAIANATTLAAQGDSNAAHVAATTAVNAIEELLATEIDGQNGMWSTWHLNDWLDGYASLLDSCRAAAHALTAPQSAFLKRPWRFGTGKWNSFFQYDVQHASGQSTVENFPFFYSHPELVNFQAPATFTSALRFDCDNAKMCAITVRGGIFNGSTTVHILPVSNSFPHMQVRYCFGSVVPNASTCHQYNPSTPIVVSGNSTTITARPFTSSGVAMDPVVRALFTHFV